MFENIDIKPVQKTKTEDYGGGIRETFTETRYVIVEKGTGKVIDDAQGYGYKTRKKAYAAYAYKNRSPEQVKRDNEEITIFKKWAKENESFMRTLECYLFEIAKGSWGSDDKFDEKLLRMVEENEGVKIPLPYDKFIKLYCSKRAWKN